MPFAICIAGQKRNGKDLTADHLCQRLNEITKLKWKRGSFAFTVKKIFSENFGVSLEFIEEWKTKDYPPPGFNGLIRDGLTKIGDGWRDLKEDIWIYKLFNNNTDNLIISDGRYCNELKAIRGEIKYPYIVDYTGITISIWREGYENNKPSRSEQELMPFVKQLTNKTSGPINDPNIPFDIWLRNNRTKEEWLNKIDHIVVPYVLEKFKI